MIAQLFVNPVVLNSWSLWLVVPLCALVALVYKAIRVEHVRDLPRQALNLWALIVLGLIALAIAFYLLLEYVA